MNAEEIGWDKSTLKAVFRRGLNPNTELACRDDEATLDSLMDLAIHLDNLLLDHQPRTHLTNRLRSSLPEPMQLGKTPLIAFT